ncbi:equilibrative nucleoside transporter [Anaeramoeba ignava]|uniref:Equilibrative nucleoside transporter n=1 Tax=Anaeramoeba ignava TaxID=1746090 RepID=A0A9Q0R902_ANAIG|nr:equilibrative nucleoside transporter [Anaeramoeba ignava]
MKSIPQKGKTWTYIVFIGLGLGHLLPFNCFITAYEYFAEAFPENSYFEFAFNSVFNTATVIGLISDISLRSFLRKKVEKKRQKKIREKMQQTFLEPSNESINMNDPNVENRRNFSSGIIISILVFIATQIFIPVLVETVKHKSAFYITIGVVFIGGFFTGIYQANMFSFAAIFLPVHTQAVMTGQGVAGAFVSLLRIFTRLSFSNNKSGLRKSSILYFSISAFLLIVILFAFLSVLKTNFVKHFLNQFWNIGISQKNAQEYSINENVDIAKESKEIETSSEDLPNSDDALLNKNMNPNPNENQNENQNEIHENENLNQNENQNSNENQNLNENQNSNENDKLINDIHNDISPQKQEPISVKHVAKSLAKFEFGVFFVFFVTLALFPSVITRIPSTHSDLTSSDWFAIIMITVFNFFDLIGRTLPRWFPKIFSSKVLIIVIVSRSIFFVLFVLCANKLIFSDPLSIIFMVIFAISNGYCSSTIMMQAPHSLKPSERDLAGGLMTTFLQIGLVLGSCSSWIFLLMLP